MDPRKKFRMYVKWDRKYRKGNSNVQWAIKLITSVSSKNPKYKMEFSCLFFFLLFFYLSLSLKLSLIDLRYLVWKLRDVVNEIKEWIKSSLVRKDRWDLSQDFIKTSLCDGTNAASASWSHNGYFREAKHSQQNTNAVKLFPYSQGGPKFTFRHVH